MKVIENIIKTARTPSIRSLTRESFTGGPKRIASIDRRAIFLLSKCCLMPIFLRKVCSSFAKRGKHRPVTRCMRKIAEIWSAMSLRKPRSGPRSQATTSSVVQLWTVERFQALRNSSFDTRPSLSSRRAPIADAPPPYSFIKARFSVEEIEPSSSSSKSSWSS